MKQKKITDMFTVLNKTNDINFESSTAIQKKNLIDYQNSVV